MAYLGEVLVETVSLVCYLANSILSSVIVTSVWQDHVTLTGRIIEKVISAGICFFALYFLRFPARPDQ